VLLQQLYHEDRMTNHLFYLNLNLDRQLRDIQWRARWQQIKDARREEIRINNRQQTLARNTAVSKRIIAQQALVSSNTRLSVRRRLAEKKWIHGIRACRVNLGCRLKIPDSAKRPLRRHIDSPRRLSRVYHCCPSIIDIMPSIAE
jgi:hypothetical protein